MAPEFPSNTERREGLITRRLVVKFGTRNLCRTTENGGIELSQEIFDDYARQIVELQRQGVQVIVVSSGAIQAGKEDLQSSGIQDRLTKQGIAGVGQPLLMSRWREAIVKAGGRGVSQLLLTYTNWSNEKERRDAIQDIFNWLNVGLIPIINENDPIADQEIQSWERRISENDRLAVMTALKIGADSLLNLTDEGGIYTDDPKKNPSARLLEEIPAWRSSRVKELTGVVNFEQSEKGVIQGAQAKWREVSRFYNDRGGNRAAIAGWQENVILDFAFGRPVGTMIGTGIRIKDAASHLEGGIA